jgi:hypothetical protein
MSDWFEQASIEGKKASAVQELVAQVAVIDAFTSAGSTPTLTDTFSKILDKSDPTLTKIINFFNGTTLVGAPKDVPYIAGNYAGKTSNTGNILDTSTLSDSPFDSIETISGGSSSITQIDTSTSQVNFELFRLNELDVPKLPTLPVLPVIDTPNYVSDVYQSNYFNRLKSDIIKHLSLGASDPTLYFDSFKFAAQGLEQLLRDYAYDAIAVEAKLGARGYRFQNSSVFRERSALNKRLVEFLINNYKKIMPAIFEEGQLLQKNGMSVQKISVEFTKSLNALFAEVTKTVVANYKKELDSIIEVYNNNVDLFQLSIEQAKVNIDTSVLDVATELLQIENTVVRYKTEAKYKESINAINQIIEWHNDSFYKNKMRQLSPLIFTALSTVANTQFGLKKDISKQEKEIEYIEANKSVVEHKLNILKNDIANYKGLVDTTGVAVDKAKIDVARKLASIKIQLKAMEGMPYIGKAVNELSNALSVSQIQLESIKES